MSKPSILVLISGSGTNLQALLDACSSGIINGEITTVISSSSKAFGIERAKKAGVPNIWTHELKTYYKGVPKEQVEERKKKRNEFDSDLAKLVINGDGKTANYTKPDLIVCAGWMLILSPSFLEPIYKAEIPIINLHPALPGAFAGINAIERAWAAGQNGEISKAGVMIHKVIQEVDEGEPLVVKELDLIKGETLEAYEARVHDIEHIAIVEGCNIALKTLVKQRK